MLLLAAAAGYPATVRGWFSYIRTNDIQSAMNKADPPPDWNVFKAAYDAAVKGQSALFEKAVVEKWLDQVERFAF